ncbi:MAG: RNA polymerase sigma factor [Chloroflexota bacterium]
MQYEEDGELIRRYVESKDERAAGAFVRKYQKFIFALAYRYCESHDEAEEITQDTFIKALDNLDKFQGKSSVKTWLYRIAKNTAINYTRKKKIFSLFSDRPVDEYENIPHSGVGAQEALESEEFEKYFQKVLRKLPEKQRETFALRYFEEMSYEEISKLLGTSVGGLKANYFQAVKKISEILKESDYYKDKF